MAKTLTVFLAADLRRFNGGMRDAQRQAQGLGGTMRNMLGPALIGAGVAAGALAIKLGVDGVKAAMEDEKAAAALARTLDNLGLAHDTAPVEAFISSLERAYGVSDLELRPAYDRLIRSTKDTAEANRALKIAMDISAGTGKSLSAVTDALGRAYDGNTQSLQRLGLGIDRTALAAMSLDEIVDTLADTFKGQAEANARTFQGQLGRLQTAVGNLQEAFGIGLLGALGDTNDTTQRLVDTMEKFEPVLAGLGGAFGRFASTGLKTYTDAIGDADVATEDLQRQMEGLGAVAAGTGALIGEIFASLTGPNSPIGVALRAIGAFNTRTVELSRSADRLAGESIRRINDGLRESDFRYQDAAVRAQRLNAELQQAARNHNAAAAATRGGSKAKDEYTKKQQRLIDLAKIQGSVLETSKRELIDQIGVLEDATKAVEDYANAIQQDLLRGFDLGGLYEGSLDEQGRFSADRFFASFDDAINKAEWFGGVLQALKARNVDQRLIEQIASLGPDVGGNLAEEMLTGDGAMVQTLVDKWNRIQDTTRELAMGLVPEFLTAGRESAIDTLNGMAEQFRRDQRRFARLGERLGQQVGAEFKKQIARDVAEAVRAVEAAATAARAEAVARAEAQQARITEQAVATAISNLIRNSDQRAGRNVSPVLQ